MPAFVREMHSGRNFEVGDIALIGRAEGVGIRLDDSSVSRQHAAIRYEDARFWLQDLGSANGTFVNGVALTAARVLCNGDRLQIGACTLIFEEGILEFAEVGIGSDRTQISAVSPVPAHTVPVTILVCDLKGFTRICEVLSASEVADLLREWYGDCDRILKRHGASIDSFIGDCVFAYWHGTGFGARADALAAASALGRLGQNGSSAVRMRLGEVLGQGLDCGIGLHIGMVSLGAMGRGVSTALGDAVNLAFRIEGLTRSVERPVLVSAAFVDGWPEDAAFEPCGRHPVKGYSETVEVFAPVIRR